MKRRILFIQNPGDNEVLQRGIPLMVERYKVFFRSEAGGYWNNNEFIDVDRLTVPGGSVQSDFIFKMKEINSLDVDYSMIIFTGHGAALDKKDHIQLESGELCPIDCLTKGIDGQDIKRTIILDACRVGYISTPKGWILESKAFSGDYQLNGADCREYYNSLIHENKPHVDIIQSTQYGEKAFGSASGTDFSTALIDTLQKNANDWNALALENRYGQLTKSYPDIESLVKARLYNQIPCFSQTKQEKPFPLYAVWRPTNRTIEQKTQEIQIICD